MGLINHSYLLQQENKELILSMFNWGKMRREFFVINPFKKKIL